MDLVAEDLSSNAHSPKVCGKKTNVQEHGTTHTKDQRAHAVKQRKRKSVSCQVSTHGAVPRGILERSSVKDSRLYAVDDHAEKTHHTNDLVQWSLGDEELFRDIAEAIERGTKQCEQVAFDSVERLKLVRACDVVGCQ